MLLGAAALGVYPPSPGVPLSTLSLDLLRSDGHPSFWGHTLHGRLLGLDEVRVPCLVRVVGARGGLRRRCTIFHAMPLTLLAHSPVRSFGAGPASRRRRAGHRPGADVELALTERERGVARVRDFTQSASLPTFEVPFLPHLTSPAFFRRAGVQQQPAWRWPCRAWG
jgi:hypothetical protein